MGEPKKIKQRFISTIYAIYATKSEFIENGSAIQVIGFFFDNFRFHSTNRLIKLFNSACHHQSPSNQYSYYKFKLIRDNYSIIIVTLYISNVRYTCLYIITRYHSSYQIQTIIYILLVSLLEN